MNVVQTGIEQALGYAVDWSSTASWVQAVFSVGAIGAAIWIDRGARRADVRRERRAREQADISFMEAAVAAVEHAEAAMSEAQNDWGGLVRRTRDMIAMGPALHMLDAAESALVSLPLTSAPNGETARALVSATNALRRVSGNARLFLADQGNGAMSAQYDIEEAQLAGAAQMLRAQLSKVTLA